VVANAVEVFVTVVDRLVVLVVLRVCVLDTVLNEVKVSYK